MRIPLSQSMLFFLTAALLSGCSGVEERESELTKAPPLSEENQNDLAYMGNEERLAYDIYMALYRHHKTTNDIKIKQLHNIATNSETKHIAKVRELVTKYKITDANLTELNTPGAPVASSTTAQDQLPEGRYDIQYIQDLYDRLLAKGKRSAQDALEVGCMVEVTDIEDLNPRIERARSSGAQDLEEAFVSLRKGSYNHYWAFDTGLRNRGVDAGCCALGDAWCHPEYPEKSRRNVQRGGKNH